VKKVNIIGYNFAFFEVVVFSLKITAIIGFLVHKLIKHVHNPIKDEHKLINQKINPIKYRFI